MICLIFDGIPFPIAIFQESDKYGKRFARTPYTVISKVGTGIAGRVKGA